MWFSSLAFCTAVLFRKSPPVTFFVLRTVFTKRLHIKPATALKRILLHSQVFWCIRCITFTHSRLSATVTNNLNCNFDENIPRSWIFSIQNWIENFCISPNNLWLQNATKWLFQFLHQSFISRTTHYEYFTVPLFCDSFTAAQTIRPAKYKNSFYIHI